MSMNWGGKHPLVCSCSLFPFSLLSSPLLSLWSLRVMFMGPTVASRAAARGEWTDAYWRGRGPGALSGPTWWQYSTWNRNCDPYNRAGMTERLSLVPYQNPRIVIGCRQSDVRVTLHCDNWMSIEPGARIERGDVRQAGGRQGAPDLYIKPIKTSATYSQILTFQTTSSLGLSLKFSDDRMINVRVTRICKIAHEK